MDGEARGKRLAAQRILLFWTVASFAVLGGVGTGYVPESHLAALQGLYTTFTISALTLAGALWGLDAWGAQIIPAMKGGSR